MVELRPSSGGLGRRTASPRSKLRRRCLCCLAAVLGPAVASPGLVHERAQLTLVRAEYSPATGSTGFARNRFILTHASARVAIISANSFPSRPNILSASLIPIVGGYGWLSMIVHNEDAVGAVTLKAFLQRSFVSRLTLDLPERILADVIRSIAPISNTSLKKVLAKYVLTNAIS